MNVKQMMNWILYGNKQGNFSKVTTPTTKEYDSFIKSVYRKEEEKYDDGQGREYDILDDELN